MLSHPSYRVIRNTLTIFALVSVLTILGQIARMIGLLVSSLFG
jgi:hypothetical protein